MAVFSEETIDFLLCLTISQLLVLIGLLILNGRNYTRGKVAILFCCAVLGFLVVHLGKTDSYWFHYLFMALDYVLPFTFFLLCKALFDDDFQWKRWMFIVLLLIPILYFSFYYKISYTSDLQGFEPVFTLIKSLGALVFAVLAIVEALKTRAEDLILERIEFRRRFILIIAITIGIIVVTEATFNAKTAPFGFELFQKFAIFLMTFYFSMQLLTLRKGFFWNGQLKEVAVEKPTIDQQLVNKLLQSMETDKMYRTEGLSIRQLADKLEVKEYKLRQTINQQLNFRNFSAFLNSYRIQEACDLLSNPELKELTIIEIAYQVGYNSLAPFNKAFKQIAEMTPTEWRKKHISA